MSSRVESTFSCPPVASWVKISTTAPEGTVNAAGMEALNLLWVWSSVRVNWASGTTRSGDASATAASSPISFSGAGAQPRTAPVSSTTDSHAVARRPRDISTSSESGWARS